MEFNKEKILLNAMLLKKAAVCNLLSGDIICFKCCAGPFRHVIPMNASSDASVYITANLLGLIIT